MNVLFVCTHNQLRSRTAEQVFKKHSGWRVRSAGTSLLAPVRVSSKLLEWADVIYVMEPKHQEIISEKFSEIVIHKKVICLDIPDEFAYMDPELVELLRNRVEGNPLTK